MNIKDAIKQFTQHSRFEKNLSIKTLKAYSIDLKQFINHCGGDVEINEVSRDLIKEFLVSLSHLKPKSVKRKIATIKALFNFLEYEDKILINPFRKIKIKLKEPFVLRTVLDIKEVAKILRCAYKKMETIRNKSTFSYFEVVRDVCILELLFCTGARVSEISELTNDSICIKKGVLLFKGKGNKEREIQICNTESLNILKEYLKLRESAFKMETDSFLVNRRKNKLSDQSIRAIISKTTKSAGISRPITPHVFRHTFATLLLEKNVDIKYIQSMLGHSSIQTTQIYTHVNKKHQRLILKTKHPRKDFTTDMVSLNEG